MIRLLLAVLVLGTLVPPHAARAAVSCGAADADGSQACFIDPALNPAALCNDGTEPAFWVRPGSGSGRHKWLIWLEGGGHCWDQASCAARAATAGTAPLLTSNGWVASDGVGALSPLSSVNPLLYNANTVMVHYCSSDTWSGAYTPPAGTSFNTSNPSTWNFQGHAIARAAIQSLGELPDDFAGATEIVLGGDSAGGVGIVINANALLPLLPKAPTILLADDAGFNIDIGQFDAQEPAPHVYPGTPTDFDLNFADGIALWHGSGAAACAAAAVTSQQQVACYDTSVQLQQGTIALPTFVAESQLDTAQVNDELCPSQDGKCVAPTNPASAQGIYATNFATTMRAALVGSGTKAAFSVVSPDAYMHVILQDPTQFTAPFAVPGGTSTARDAWDAWLADPKGPRSLDLGNGPGVAAPKS